MTLADSEGSRDARDIPWQRLSPENVACSIVSVSEEDGKVVICFGDKERLIGPGIRPRLLHRVVMTPAVANGLRELLTKLLSDYHAPLRDRGSVR